MLRPLHACALSLCLTASPAVFAESITAYGRDQLASVPGTHDIPPPTFSPSLARWDWSTDLVSATQALGITPAGNAHPAIHTDPVNVFQDLSVFSLTMDRSLTDGSLKVLSEQWRGDIVLSGKGSKLSSGPGSLTMSDPRIDHLSKQVFAKVNGATGTETAIFSFDAPAWVLPQNAVIPILTCLPGRPHCIANLEILGSHPVLNNLQFTTQGRTLWDQSFQLTAVGKMLMDSVDNLGTASVTAVPEPSSWAMLGIGLVGIGLARRKRAA